jgi:SAM-dependent methyltransferase
MKPVWQTHLVPDPPLDETYHAMPRTEIASWFAEAPGVVVDVGCGAGATGGLIKAKFPGTRVIGIERNANAAAIARTHLDEVIVADLADADLAAHLRGQSVGALLLLDVLEHLEDPWRALVAMRAWLGPDSRVIASVPNLRNLHTLDDLAAGRFDYGPWGVLDVTHLRFFTRASLGRMFEETGYEVRSIDALPLANPEGLSLEHGDGYVRTANLTIRCTTRADLEDLHAMQLVLEARPAPAAILRR